MIYLGTTVSNIANVGRPNEELKQAVSNSSVSNVLNTVLKPADLANAAAFLCLPDSGRITGQTIQVNAEALMN